MRYFDLSRLSRRAALQRGAALAGLVFLAACGGPLKTDAQLAQERARHYVQSHPELDPRIQEAILGTKLLVGMKKEEVLAAWGRPIRIVKFREGRQEEWIFGCNYPHLCTRQDRGRHRSGLFDSVRYESQAIFEDGVLTSFRF